MTLRIKFFVTTGFAIIALAGVSEWATYHQTAAFLNAHEALMRHGPEGAALLTLPAQKHLLLIKLTGARLLNTAIATLALITVLNFLWGRFITSPMRHLLTHINWMSRGTWKTPMMIHQKDEMGDLTRAFNALGEQLTLTVQQFAGASKLSCLALLSQRVARSTEDAKTRILEAKGRLFSGVKSHPGIALEAATALEEATEILDGIRAQVEAEFYGQLRELGAAPWQIDATARKASTSLKA